MPPSWQVLLAAAINTVDPTASLVHSLHRQLSCMVATATVPYESVPAVCPNAGWRPTIESFAPEINAIFQPVLACRPSTAQRPRASPPRSSMSTPPTFTALHTSSTPRTRLLSATNFALAGTAAAPTVLLHPILTCCLTSWRSYLPGARTCIGSSSRRTTFCTMPSESGCVTMRTCAR